MKRRHRPRKNPARLETPAGGVGSKFMGEQANRLISLPPRQLLFGLAGVWLAAAG